MSGFLEVEGASKAFGGIRAVDEMDFSVTAGEICGVIGPNGSGKTTLLGLLSGTYRLDRGAIRLKAAGSMGFPPTAPCRLASRAPSRPLACFFAGRSPRPSRRPRRQGRSLTATPQRTLTNFWL
jgi:ABC-type oligopeptide transport system ATPase subunit